MARGCHWVDGPNGLYRDNLGNRARSFELEEPLEKRESRRSTRKVPSSALYRPDAREVQSHRDLLDRETPMRSDGSLTGTAPSAFHFCGMAQDDDLYSGLYERAAKLRAELAEAIAKARQELAQARRIRQEIQEVRQQIGRKPGIKKPD